MLNTLVRIEEPQKEKQRVTNINELYNYKNKIDKTEKHILDLISSANPDDLLNNEELINALESSKEESAAITQRIYELSEDQK